MFGVQQKHIYQSDLCSELEIGEHLVFILIFNEKNKLPGMGSIRCSLQKLIYSGKNIHIKTEMEY